MEDHKPTVRSRALGAELRWLWEQAGFNGSRLARALGWSPGRVSRLQSGKRFADEVQVANVLGFCGVGETAEFHELIALCREVRNRTWLRSHRGLVPDPLRTLLAEERAASAITEYAPHRVPDLLQTQGYARALLVRAGLGDEAEVDVRVQALRQHRDVFNRLAPLRFVFYVSEQVLRTPVADARVMNDQLLHLASRAALPHCSIRVLPAPHGLGGPLSEPFRLLKYPEFAPVVYVSYLTASLFLEEPDDIAAYAAVLDRLDQLTLNRQQSSDLLQRLASDYDRPRYNRVVATLSH